MGCIVNGPGEMADSHYGYVGSGKGKVNLYKGKECVKKNIDAGDAVDWTKVKTIGFAQNSADGVEHTLYVDDMRVIKGTTTVIPASQPTGVIAKGYNTIRKDGGVVFLNA